MGRFSHEKQLGRGGAQDQTVLREAQMGASGCWERLERRDVLCGCERKANEERRQWAVGH